MVNRIIEAIEKTRVKLDKLSGDEKEELFKQLDLTVEEVIAYQDAQARAHAEGRITLEEANTIYNAIGSWKRIDLPTKVVVVKVITELILR